MVAYTKNKQPLSNFQAQIGADPKQSEAQLKNGVAYRKKRVMDMPGFHSTTSGDVFACSWYSLCRNQDDEFDLCELQSRLDMPCGDSFT